MRKTKNKTKNIKLHQRAEEILNIKKVKPRPVLSELETLILMHELEVHQIELELQNEELMQARDRAEIAEIKYTELFDFAPLGYLTITKAGTIVELNFCAARMLGRERSGLVNSTFSNFVSEGTRQEFKYFLKNVFSSEVKNTCELILTVDRLSPLNVQVDGIVVNNRKLCFMSITDISDRKLLEKNKIAKENAEESNRLKTAFLHNMSHEIRSPMNAIIGFSDILTNYFEDKEKLSEYSNIINTQSKDLLNIINDILDIAKIESGQISVELEEFNLSDLFEELKTILTEIQTQLYKQKINFDLKVCDELSNRAIITDKIKLKQILINLITNSFKFTNQGNVEGGCKIENESFIRFYVSDTGIGIPLDKQELIFDRFTQLKHTSNEKAGGTGLGLSIVKGLVNLLGGSISLDSKPGIGSTFSFNIPLKTSNSLSN